MTKGKKMNGTKTQNAGAKRTTVNSLKDEFERLAHKVKQHEAQIAELKRKARGTTLANARVVQLQAELEAVKARVVGRAETLGSIDDPVVLQGYQQEFERLDKRIEDLYGNLSSELRTLQETVDSHTGRLANHETRIGMVEEGQSSLHRRVSVVEEVSKFPKGKLVAALVAGVVAAIIWWAIPFSGSFQLPDGTDVPLLYTYADGPLGAGLFGVFVFAGLLGLLMLFKSRQTSESTEQRQGIAPPQQAETRKLQAADNTAPTKVLPTAVGASSSTRA